MKQLYKYGVIKILTKEQLLNFDYANFTIRQIENIGEDIYCVESLSKSQFIDILRY